MKVGDLEYMPAVKQFILAMNRFAWEAKSGLFRQHKSGGKACCISTGCWPPRPRHRPRQAGRGAVAAGDPLRRRSTSRPALSSWSFPAAARSGSTSNASRRGWPTSAAPGTRRRAPSTEPEPQDGDHASTVRCRFRGAVRRVPCDQARGLGGGRRRGARDHRAGARRGRRGARRLLAEIRPGRPRQASALPCRKTTSPRPTARPTRRRSRR